ncbi:hypothetical protein [Formosa haliotis]|uniref:hypothetical protein n=1 Tax=Formosa haliotis TaxID=1555194 RepID=UPI000825FE98|nr:hypothetical protein [Formosa haliotis]
MNTSFTKMNILFYFLLFQSVLHCQSVIEGKLVWKIPQQIPSIDFQIVSIGEVGGNTGQESVVLRATNTTNHTLLYNATIKINSFSGTTYTRQVEKAIKPGETLGKNAFNDGFDLSFDGEQKKTYPKPEGGTMKSYISTVQFTLNSLEDLTQKEIDKSNRMNLKQVSNQKQTNSISNNTIAIESDVTNTSEVLSNYNTESPNYSDITAKSLIAHSLSGSNNTAATEMSQGIAEISVATVNLLNDHFDEVARKKSDVLFEKINKYYINYLQKKKRI